MAKIDGLVLLLKPKPGWISNTIVAIFEILEIDITS